MIKELVIRDERAILLDKAHGDKVYLPMDYIYGTIEGKWYKSLYETTDLFSEGICTACCHDDNFELMPKSEYLQVLRHISSADMSGDYFGTGAKAVNGGYVPFTTAEDWQKRIDKHLREIMTDQSNGRVMSIDESYQEYLKNGGTFNGTGECSFLETPLDRMYFIKIIGQVIDLYEYDSLSNYPTDPCAQGSSVADSNKVMKTRFDSGTDWDYPPANENKLLIASAINAGVLTKDKNGYAKLEDDMTRAECVVMLNRIFYSGRQNKDVVPKQNKFSDLNPNAWYYNDVLKAVKN